MKKSTLLSDDEHTKIVITPLAVDSVSRNEALNPNNIASDTQNSKSKDSPSESQTSEPGNASNNSMDIDKKEVMDQSNALIEENPIAANSPDEGKSQTNGSSPESPSKDNSSYTPIVNFNCNGKDTIDEEPHSDTLAEDDDDNASNIDCSIDDALDERY